MNELQDRILEKLYIKGEYHLTSPLMVGSGENSVSDMDVLKDSLGNVFIPGTSLAGALRSYLAGGCSEKEENDIILQLFGKREKDSTQSLIYVSDAILKSSPSIRIRDGVALDVITKTSKNKEKYNYEIVEPGAIFEMRFEVLFRDRHCDDTPKLKHGIYVMLQALQDGEIFFGAKTRRGFGKGELKKLQMIHLNFETDNREDDLQTWINFSWDEMKSNYTLEQLQREAKVEALSSINYIDISVKFSLPYSLLIRDYMTKPDDPDTVQLCSGSTPVIPGTSWAGALKHQMKRICAELGIKEKKRNDETSYEIIEQLFGFVDKEAAEPSEKARASRIFLEESPVNQALPLTYTRNKIDRFTGGTVTGALFDMRPVYGKEDTELSLNIKIRDARNEEIGLLLLAIQDLWNGIQPIGGETNVGRGILEGKCLTINGNAVIFSENDETYQHCMQALYTYLLTATTR